MPDQVTQLGPQDYCSFSTLLLWGLPSQLRSLSDFSFCFLSFSSHLQVAGGQGFCVILCTVQQLQQSLASVKHLHICPVTEERALATADAFSELHLGCGKHWISLLNTVS